MDAPSPGGEVPGGSAAGGTAQAGDPKMVADPVVQKLLEELRELDKKAPASQAQPGPNAELVKYNVERAELIDRILAKVSKAEDRDQWVRQLADSLGAAAQASPKEDKAAYVRLQKFAEQLAHDQPGSALAGYVTFREMQADYAVKLQGAPDFA